MQNKKLGYEFEKIAEKFLIQKGYQILNKNFTIRWGEIDMVVKKNNIVSFVEVKWSSKNIDFQNYITKSKIAALKRTAQHWIYRYDNDDISEYRFDLILIENNKVVDFLEWFLE